jgi:hypothetical protein
MKWRKLGRIFSVSGQLDWMQTHAAVPFADHLHDDVFRIFFTTRDAKNRSHTGFVDLDIRSPDQVLKLSGKPVLKPGALGTFDDSGAMGSWITRAQGRKYLYYQGGNLGTTVPFRNAIGVAFNSSDDEFRPYSPGPILDRNMFEPHFTGTPCVLYDGAIWRMWYLSCTEWRMVDGVPQHHYNIKHAHSDDGINWVREGNVAIDYSGDAEYAISRPSVLLDKSGWHMWYSYRGEKYRIGYATSQNGLDWVRCDDAVGIEVSTHGWDSEMIEYPFVFDHGARRLMLYNGNEYGRTGIGLAELEH